MQHDATERKNGYDNMQQNATKMERAEKQDNHRGTKPSFSAKPEFRRLPGDGRGPGETDWTPAFAGETMYAASIRGWNPGSGLHA